MSIICCNPLEFVQSLTKKQRQALQDILQFRGKGDYIIEMLQKATDRAK